jgi:dolichyl-phosphate-mannose-protein mannosyltransferase
MKIKTLFRRFGQPAKWLGVLGVVLLFTALRWNSCSAPLIRDEGEYAYSAQLLIHCVAPYEHAFIQKPPMVIYSYALANLLLPDVFWSARLLAYLFVALATVLLGYIARQEFGKDFALPTMWLATPMILLPSVDQFPANTEMFMLLPLLATFAIYVCARHCGHKPKYWLAAGFLGVTTLCYKYTALPLLVFVFAVWSVELWRQTHDARLFRLNWLAAVIGGFLAVILELGYFFIHDGGARFWECTVIFNRYYVASNNFSMAYFWSRIGIFWNNWWVLFFVPWAAFLQPIPRIWFWLSAFACAFLATSASGYAQYYIVIMPFLALLSVVGIRAMAARIAKWSVTSSRWIGSLLTIIVLLLIIRPEVPWLTCTPERFAEVKMDGYPFSGSKAVAKRVAELSAPGEFVFVAGSEPQILFYAQRFSPTRFITAYALMIPTAMTRKYQLEAIGDLQEHPPKLIVFTPIKNSWLRQTATPPDFPDFLEQFLRQNYVLIGGYLPYKQKGVWSEPLATNEVADANLLLFMHKPP